MRIFTFFISFFACAVALAQADGFYRVKNHKTERYISVIDNRGSVNLATSDADLGALKTVKPFETIVSDPSTIIYFKSVPSANGYNLETQGVDTYSIIGYYVKMRESRAVSGAYQAYAEAKGLVKYLSDEDWDGDEGVVMTSGSSTRDWYLLPVDAATDNYFGLIPSVAIAAEGAYYHTLYAGFANELVSEGMKAYYVDRVDGGLAVWKEIDGGIIPEATAVIVKMASDKAANNRLQPLATTPASIKGNLMKGVYFNNGSNKHNNQKKFDANTMRVLGKLKDGSVGFVAPADLKFIPANTAYLTVPAGSSAEIKLVSEDEYKILAGVEGVEADVKPFAKGIYSVCGVKLSDDAATLNQLPAGIYIVDGKKVVVGRK
ncbi:MAG: hypothetical protein II200_06275 [Bacteroidaceae bacterium]|nr:hypothetical protein [Bacteroidaceae bacterium]